MTLNSRVRRLVKRPVHTAQLVIDEEELRHQPRSFDTQNGNRMRLIIGVSATSCTPHALNSVVSACILLFDLKRAVII